MGQTLSRDYKYNCQGGTTVFEFFRSIRNFFSEYVQNEKFTLSRLLAAQLGLTHVYSRNRISEDVEKADKHILQSTALIQQMEKNLNLFTMRIKEWYAWHFPELSKIVPDNKTYVQCVLMIQDKAKLDEENLESLEELIKSGDLA